MKRFLPLLALPFLAFASPTLAGETLSFLLQEKLPTTFRQAWFTPQTFAAEPVEQRDVSLAKQPAGPNTAAKQDRWYPEQPHYATGTDVGDCPASNEILLDGPCISIFEGEGKAALIAQDNPGKPVFYWQDETLFSMSMEHSPIRQAAYNMAACSFATIVESEHPSNVVDVRNYCFVKEGEPALPAYPIMATETPPAEEQPPADPEPAKPPPHPFRQQQDVRVAATE